MRYFWTQVIFDSLIELSQVPPFQVDLGVMAMTVFSTFLRVQEWILTVRWFRVVSRTFVGIITPLKRCSRRILQPPADWAASHIYHIYRNENLIYIYIRGGFNKFPDFFVQAFNIVVDSWKFSMSLLYILWDDWRIFMISASNEQQQQQSEYTLLKPDCHSWWISNFKDVRIF